MIPNYISYIYQIPVDCCDSVVPGTVEYWFVRGFTVMKMICINGILQDVFVSNVLVDYYLNMVLSLSVVSSLIGVYP